MPPRIFLNIHNTRYCSTPELEKHLTELRQKIDQGVTPANCGNHSYEQIYKAEKRRAKISQKEQLTIEDFMRDNDLIIKAADKNLGITIMTTADYIQKALNLLQDTKTYEKIECIDIHAIKTHTENKIHHIQKYLTKQELRFILYHTDCDSTPTVPFFHILPKVHKKGEWTGRPIVGNVNWVTTNLSKFLNNHYKKWCDQNLQKISKDTKSVIQKLHNMKIAEDEFFFSFDAISMYTNIPLIETFQKMKNIFPEYIIDLTELCCKNNFMQFGGEIYRQIDGLPMGANFSVSLANISVHLLVEDKMESFAFSENLRFYTRYIDDTLGIWKGKKEELDIYFNQFNSHEKIKWTQDDFGKKIHFLDLYISVTPDPKLVTHAVTQDDTVTQDPKDICINLYQKKMNKYLYIPYDSNHTIHTKKGWVKGELIRMCRNTNNLENFIENTMKFKSRLLNRKYPEFIIDDIIQNFNYDERLKLLDLKHDIIVPPLPPNLLDLLTSAFNKTDFFKQYIEQEGSLIAIQNNTEEREVYPTFSSPYSRLLNFTLKQTLQRIPPILVKVSRQRNQDEKEILIHFKPRLSYFIRNKLGKLFTHKKNEKKIAQNLQGKYSENSNITDGHEEATKSRKQEEKNLLS
jgi:hypothetical protein